MNLPFALHVVYVLYRGITNRRIEIKIMWEKSRYTFPRADMQQQFTFYNLKNGTKQKPGRHLKQMKVAISARYLLYVSIHVHFDPATMELHLLSNEADQLAAIDTTIHVIPPGSTHAINGLTFDPSAYRQTFGKYCAVFKVDNDLVKKGTKAPVHWLLRVVNAFDGSTLHEQCLPDVYSMFASFNFCLTEPSAQVETH